MRTLAVVAVAAALAGCASNGYREYFQAQPQAPTPAQAAFLAGDAAPQVLRTGIEHYADTVQKYRSQGYALLGTAAFNGLQESPKHAVAQAKQLGATLVVLASRYTDTQTEVTPVTVPTSDVVYRYRRVGGQVVPTSYTVYGSLVVPMATQVRNYDHVAAFLVKLKTLPHSGLLFTGLTPALRQLYGRNTGAVVDVVLEDSPAFRADVLEGDLIIAIDGQPVQTPDEARRLLEAVPPRGGTVKLTLVRDKKTQELSLAL